MFSAVLVEFWYFFLTEKMCM